MEKLIMAKEMNGALGEFQVFPYGEVDIEGDPPVLLDEEVMNPIINILDRHSNDLVVDYEHQTLKNSART
jgi:phage I-like protein